MTGTHHELTDCPSCGDRGKPRSNDGHDGYICTTPTADCRVRVYEVVP